MSRILIVEDDPAIAELERDYLEMAGHTATIEPNGRRGLTRALSGSFDLVLLDLMLPGMDGMEVCRTLRASSDVPVLMVTARTSDDDKIRGLGLGADDYVEKPFSPGVLVARVEARLRRYAQIHGMSDEVVRTSRVTIDTARRRVEVDGRVVELRTKEYELLLFLARNAERVLGRDLLYERVWGPGGTADLATGEVVGDPSTVTVHVKRLRDKIERDPAHPELIQTVRGAGYRLAE